MRGLLSPGILGCRVKESYLHVWVHIAFLLRRLHGTPLYSLGYARVAVGGFLPHIALSILVCKVKETYITSESVLFFSSGVCTKFSLYSECL